jgi:hypothetical protein
VPTLFAVTLFVSATLLFMVQPMVGKLVLPLLGGSPAVWNACMVFFQALLLLGYLYADRLTKKAPPKRQWMIHMAVLSLPLGVFALSVLFGSRHTPIAVAESLAPSDESSPILSVLALLTVAIGIPFFVVSTSATLLQRWFTYTGHPAARDPYFLYAASNAGSLISLLGYPIFIEPNLSQGGQTWVWAVGFAALIGLIALCGKAAVNPLGVPPAPAKQAGGRPANAPAASEPPPTLGRMAKWTALAFVPSSLMLGVTFHMTTDIASIPLLWVVPLALYLVTFIIAFMRLPPGFRILIGNLAPVMILLLVFVLISKPPIGVGPELLLHLAAFFAAALMCHYELARDRPAPQYLTTYFLIMSFGGVLGGIFNSLVAPLVFPFAYEYPLALLVACLMVPRMNPLTNDEKESKMGRDEALATDMAVGAGMNPVAYAGRWLSRLVDRNNRVAVALDIIVPVLMGIAFWQLRELLAKEWFAGSEGLAVKIKNALTLRDADPVKMVFVYALPVMVCFFFVDRPVRFALCVAAILGQSVYNDSGRDSLYSERSFFGILKVEENTSYQRPIFKTDEGKLMVSGEIEYVRLVHGTTLHGTQVKRLENNAFDSFQMLTAANPWDNLANVGALHTFDMRQEPLTYYHRTGPVGAMFAELTRRGKDREHVAMVGLGTGSVSCYAMGPPKRPGESGYDPALPLDGQKGQKLTFYEIDPAVKRIVETPRMVLNPKEVEQGKPPIMGPFTFVDDARKRGAEIDFRMGDARLKLKEDVNVKYALLLVDAFSSDSIPVHLLTKEAVQLYMNRITEDGILALHISNKFVSLEPVVAKIAEELRGEYPGMIALVWRDDAEGRPGKTASSWCVLARDKKHLGKLHSPIADLIGKYGGGSQLRQVVQVIYPDSTQALEKLPTKPQESLVEWLEARTADPQAQEFARLIKTYGAFTPLMTVLHAEAGHGFRPMTVPKNMAAWTDDYADVMQVMMIPQVQSLRRIFGLPRLEDE